FASPFGASAPPFALPLDFNRPASVSASRSSCPSSPASNACSRSSSPQSVLSCATSPRKSDLDCADHVSLASSSRDPPRSPPSLSLHASSESSSGPHAREGDAERCRVPASPSLSPSSCGGASLASLSPPLLRHTDRAPPPSLSAETSVRGVSLGVSSAAPSSPQSKMEGEDDVSLFKKGEKGSRTRLASKPSAECADTAGGDSGARTPPPTGATDDPTGALSPERPTAQKLSETPGAGVSPALGARKTPRAEDAAASPSSAPQLPRRLNDGAVVEGPLPNELEMVIPRFRARFLEGIEDEGDSPIDTLTLYSDWVELPSLRFRLMVHPLTRSHNRQAQLSPPSPLFPEGAARALSPQQQEYLQSRTTAAFVEIGRKPDWPADWIFQSAVRFHIYVVNLTEPERSVWREETFQFSCEEIDRGWHAIVSYLTLFEERFFAAPSGDLVLRAAVFPAGTAVMSRGLRTPCPASPPLGERRRPSDSADPRDTEAAEAEMRERSDRGGGDEPKEDDAELGPVIAGQPVDTSSPLASLFSSLPPAASLGRAGKGYVGLRNHGATCYMNALLQSLYYIGKFRQAVYALTFDTKAISGCRSIEVLESRCRRRKRRAGGSGASADGDEARDARDARHDRNLDKDEDMIDGSCDVQMEDEGSALRPTGRASKGASGRPSYDSSPYFSPVHHPLASLLLNSDDEDDEDFSDWNERDMRDLLLEEEQEQRRPPSISLALQNLFFRLYTSKEPVACRDLIRSFGWDAADAFTQQDTHELLKLLLDKVEEQMQRTPAEGSVKKMFEGEMETYIECIEVDYKSVRKETYEDLNLDVKGCNNIQESLRRLVQPEILEGENSYDAEAFGKQRARKGVRFLRFPPVCIFLLKRFDFDYEKMDTVKVFSSFEFQSELDLNEFCPGAGVYELHAVSVHQGDVNSGHYYCFLRPPPRTQWVRFDDDKVYPVSEYAAIGDNFGGDEEDPCNYLAGKAPRSRQKVYNAYILVYVKKRLANQLLADCNPMKVNPQVVVRCRTEELLMKLRNRIRRVLEQRIKVKVYHPLQFLNRRFLDLPLATMPPLVEIKSSRSVGVLPIHEQITSRLFAKLYGEESAGASEGGASQRSSAKAPSIAFLLYAMDFLADDARFSPVAIADNPCLGEIFRSKMLGNGGRGSGVLGHRTFPGSSADQNYPYNRFDACLYFLAVPETNAVIRSALDHDEFCRRHQLLFLKYFDIFGANKMLDAEPGSAQDPKGKRKKEDSQAKPPLSAGKGEKKLATLETQDEATEGVPESLRDSNVVCVDVVLVPNGWRLVCLQPHLYRRLLRCMDDGLVRPYAVESLRRYVASLGSLPPLFAVSGSGSGLFFPLTGSEKPCLVDVASSQSCSLAACAAAYGAGLSATLCGPVFSTQGNFPALSGSREQTPDLPRDAALALVLALEIEFQDLKNPTSLTLSSKKTFSQEKIFPGDIFVFNIEAPENMRRRFQEIRRLAEVSSAEREPTTTEEFGLSASADGHDLLAQLYLDGRGLPNVPSLLPAFCLAQTPLVAADGAETKHRASLSAEEGPVSLSPSSSSSSSPSSSSPPSATGAAAHAISTAARAALGDADTGDKAEDEKETPGTKQKPAEGPGPSRSAEASTTVSSPVNSGVLPPSRASQRQDAAEGKKGDSSAGQAPAGSADGTESAKKEERPAVMPPSSDGGLLPFLPAARGGKIPVGPPEMPLLPSPDFHHYSLNKANRFVFQFRLYDPLELLNRPMNCCGMLLEDYPRPSTAPSASSVSLASRDLSLSQCSSNETLSSFTLASSPSTSSVLAADPYLPGASSKAVNASSVSSSLLLPAASPSPVNPLGATAGPFGAATAVGGPGGPAGPQRSTSGVSVGDIDCADGDGAGDAEEDEDPWIHVPKGQPVAAKMLEVDVRVACNQVLRYVSWYLGTDSSRLFLFPEPPLLSDPAYEPVSIDSLVCFANEGAGTAPRRDSSGGASPEASMRRLSVNEVFSRLEKKALQCTGSRLGRRRSRTALGAFPFSGTSGSRPRIFHLALMPRHYSLCSRVIDPHALSPAQLERAKDLIFPACSGTSSAPSPPPDVRLHDALLHFVVLVFNRRVESLGCVEGLIPARCPFSSRPLTVKDLIHAILARMPPALRTQVVEERRRLSREAGAADAARVSDAALASGLRLVASTVASLQELEKTQQVQNLPMYALGEAHGPIRQPRLDGLATQNLFAVPLRLELDWTPDEKEGIENGDLKVLQVVHQTPTDREYFGYPFEILVRPTETLNEIKHKVKEKLLLPKALWNNWTFFQYADCNRSWKGPNDRLDWQRYDSITLIAEHPAPYSKMRSHTAMKIA
ncbi:ubiquitin carboxyl-terminal hydrolase, related, partial [Neospora caninum Liverpool]